MRLLLLFLIIHSTKAQQFSTLRADYDSYGTRFASNDEVVILAQNDVGRYAFYMAPFESDTYCFYKYSSSLNFVMNVAIGQSQDADIMSFVYLQAIENDTSYLELGVFNISKTSCLDDFYVEPKGKILTYQLPLDMADVSILKTDLTGKYAYGFIDYYSYIFDIHNVDVSAVILISGLISNIYDITDVYYLIPDIYNFIPRDIDISVTSDGIQVAVLVGYSDINGSSILPAAYLLRLEPPLNMTVLHNLTLNYDKAVDSTLAYSYNFDYVMSVSIEHETQQVVVGLPYASTTLLLKFNSANITLLKSFPQSARSVGWLDNGTQAVLLLSDTPTLPWTSSQTQVINTSVNNTALATIYAIPNNQQTIVSTSSKTSISFIRLLVNNGQPVILTSTGSILYAPVASAGYFIELIDIISSVPDPKSCPPGTYKTSTGASPCVVCPTGFRTTTYNISSSNTTNFACVPCLSSSFCPLASVNDVNISLYSSVNDTYPYPDSPATTNFDDIIITNTFQINSSNRHCLVVSPIFWTLLVLGVVGIILIIMGILYWIPSGKQHFKWLASVFRRTDLVGEGELWVGGLMSFAIIVLITFGFWFGSVFLKQYPIETANDANFACDASLRNAKFTSSLQLLALLRAQEEKTIFAMLDEQKWILKVDFIQTGFRCEDIVVQNYIDSYIIKLSPNCSLQLDNATRTLTVPLVSHLNDVQFNLTGSSYIGGIRICFSGPSAINTQTHSSIKELTFCQLLSNSDQTMPYTTNVKLDFTKVINRTEGLDENDPVTFSGTWIPSLTIKSLNDEIVYEQQGSYIRYLSSQQILYMELSETQFYIKNVQEPIARSGEIIFHNILFATVCIELFGLAFLIFKLALLPLLQWISLIIAERCRNRISKSTQL